MWLAAGLLASVVCLWLSVYILREIGLDLAWKAGMATRRR